MDDPATITAVGGIIAALVILLFTIWSGRVQKAQQDEDKHKQDSVTQEIIGLQNKLLETQKEVSNYQTGGDSYCYLSFVDNLGEEKMDVYIKQAGNYPLKGIKISLVDASSLLSGGGFSDKSLSEIEVNDIKVGYYEKVYTIPAPKEQKAFLWIATFETQDGRRKWYQRTLFQARALDMGYVDNPYHPPGIQGYGYVYQVYGKSQEKALMTEQERSRAGSKGYIYTQEVIKECQSPGTVIEIQWNSTHYAAAEVGYFDKIVHKEGAKDCAGFN